MDTHQCQTEAEMTQEERLVQAAQLAGTRHPSQVRPPPPHPSRVALLASLQNQGSGPAGMESHPNIWARTLQQEPLLLLLKPQGGTRLGRTWGPRGSSRTTLQVMPSSQVLSEKVCSAPPSDGHHSEDREGCARAHPGDRKPPARPLFPGEASSN